MVRTGTHSRTSERLHSSSQLAGRSRDLCIIYGASNINGAAVHVLRAIDGFARSIDCAAPPMDPSIAHLSVDRAIMDRSRNCRNCAIDQLRTAEFAQSIDRAALESAQSINRAALESAQSVDCLRSISSHLATCLLLVSK